MDIHALPARVIAFAVLLLAVPAFAEYAALDAVRVRGDVERERDGVRTALRSADTALAGDRIHTGASGRVALQLAPVGTLTLGADGALLLHSIETVDPPARAGLARVVLERGTLRADARAQQQLAPADLRINVGALRLRVFGAEAWIERGADGDEVCVLAGAVELQTPEGPQRLDEPGSCLRAGRGGLQRLDVAASGAMAPRLARTAFPGDRAARAAAAAVVPAAAEARAAAPAAEAAPGATPEPAPADGGAWTIVLASLPEAARAEQEAQRLRAAGIDARVIEAQRGDGGTTYRIVSGRYASKDAAAPEIRALRARRGLAGAWVAPLQ